MLVVLSDSPSIQEILWNFSRLEDEKQRLTLTENPHFYTEHPALQETYGDGVKIDPTEDFQHACKFYVLADRPKPVYIMTDRVLQSFGNVWCSKNVIIFKGLGVFLFFPPSLMSWQISVGDSRGGVLSRNLS
jgi:hypothetical protein